MINIKSLLNLFFAGFLISFTALVLNLLVQQNLNYINFISISTLFLIFVKVVFEEFIFRVILMKLFFDIFKNLYISLFIQSLIFTFLHSFSYTSIVALLGYFLAGIYYSFYIFLKPQNENISFYYVVLAIGIHFGWNISQIILYRNNNDYIFETSKESLFCRMFILIFTLIFVRIYYVKSSSNIKVDV